MNNSSLNVDTGNLLPLHVLVIDVLRFLTLVHIPKLLLWLKATYICQRLEIGGERERNIAQNRWRWGFYLAPCLKGGRRRKDIITSLSPGPVTKYTFKYMEWVSIMKGRNIKYNSRMADLGKNHILHSLYSVLLWRMKVIPACWLISVRAINFRGYLIVFHYHQCFIILKHSGVRI